MLGRGRVGHVRGDDPGHAGDVREPRPADCFPADVAFGWADGESMIATLRFSPPPASPNKVVLAGTVVSGSALGSRIDGGLRMSVLYPPAVAEVEGRPHRARARSTTARPAREQGQRVLREEPGHHDRPRQLRRPGARHTEGAGRAAVSRRDRSAPGRRSASLRAITTDHDRRADHDDRGARHSSSTHHPTPLGSAPARPNARRGRRSRRPAPERFDHARDPRVGARRRRRRRLGPVHRPALPQASETAASAKRATRRSLTSSNVSSSCGFALRPSITRAGSDRRPGLRICAWLPARSRYWYSNARARSSAHRASTRSTSFTSSDSST